MSKGMFVSYKMMIAVGLLLLLVVTIIAQNMQHVTLKFLIFRFTSPVIVLVVGSLIVGGIIGAILARYVFVKKA